MAAPGCITINSCPHHRHNQCNPNQFCQRIQSPHSDSKQLWHVHYFYATKTKTWSNCASDSRTLNCIASLGKDCHFSQLEKNTIRLESLETEATLATHAYSTATDPRVQIQRIFSQKYWPVQSFRQGGFCVPQVTIKRCPPPLIPLLGDISTKCPAAF